MASPRGFILVALLLVCCCKSSDHTVQVPVSPRIRNIFPVNQTLAAGETWTGVQEQLTVMAKQLHDPSSQRLQDDNNALGLRREISQLRAQLTTCSAAASAITGTYLTQLHAKISQLLNTLDSNPSLVLKVTGLTRDVNKLRKKLTHAANSTDVTIDVTALQGELEKKHSELNRILLQTEGTLQNSSLIFQIISLQNEIWDLEHLKQRGDSSAQLDKNLSAQQAQLDVLLTRLPDQRGMPSILLQLISAQTKIARTQRLIEAHMEESRTEKSTYDRRWTQLAEQLKKKISLLSRDENNKELTMEILDLQVEIQRLKQFMSGAKTLTDTRLTQLRRVLEDLKKLQQDLQGQLEEEDYGQAQLLMKIIATMKEVRELEVSEQDHVASQANTLQNLLQTKERAYAKALTEINELKKKLRLLILTGSVVDENLIQVEADFEQEIARLNTTGESQVALVLTLVKLQNEMKSLQDLIFLTDNPKRLSELQNLLEIKEDEFNSKTKELERSVPYHKSILRVIDLQQKIWNLEDNGSSEAIVKQGEELQNSMNVSIFQIGSGGNAQTLLRLLNLHSQIESLQQQLLDPSRLQPTQVNVLQNNLSLKKTELQTFTEDLKSRNPSSAQKVLVITNLHNQLRNLQQQRQAGHRTLPPVVVPEVREQLKAKDKELSQYRTQITALQNLLEEKDSMCNSTRTELKVPALCEQLRSREVHQQQDQTQIKYLQSELDAKMKELQSKSDSVTTLALLVSTVAAQVEELKQQVMDSSSEDTVKALEKAINIKNNELANKTKELKARSSQADTFFRIVSLQVDLERLASVAESDSDYANITALQNQLHSLVAGIQDESSENTKLVFKVLVHQDETVRLKKQEQRQRQSTRERIQGLENELEDVRGQIREKTLLLLDSSDIMITDRSVLIMELHRHIKPLKEQISFLKEANANNTRDLESRLHQSNTQLQESQTQLKEVDTENYNLITEITDLRKKLKTVQQVENTAQNQRINDLEQAIETQHRETRRLENLNQDLRQELKLCSKPESRNCEEVNGPLQQCNEDAHRLLAKIQEIEASMRKLTEELEEKARDYDTLQDEHQRMESEMERLEAFVLDLQNKVTVDEETIQANKIIFDPDTANPRLVISTRNTQVTLSRTAQAVANHPGRFDVLLAVLGKGGYTSGRHYWEVNVANKDCYHLGMISESAQRKGKIIISPATDFWTIILNKQGQYSAMDRTRVIIPLQTRPLVIGILLNYKRGQISFYDATARVHMYTFTRGEPFTGTIYPFLNLCVEKVQEPTPIMLLTPRSFDWLQ